MPDSFEFFRLFIHPCAVALDLLRFFYQVKSLNCQALACLIISSRTFGCPGMTTQIRLTGLVHIFPRGDRVMRSSSKILFRTQLAFDFVNGTGDQETASRLDELAVQVSRLFYEMFILPTSNNVNIFRQK